MTTYTADSQRILIAEDDEISRRLLLATLERLDYDVVETTNGAEAWERIECGNAPRMVLLDWMMPEMDGVELCRKIRRRRDDEYTYVVFLTARGQVDDVIEGFAAGADDYLVKPFDPHELASRLNVGRRILALHRQLRGKVRELENALQHVKQLQGLLPICMHCKQIRDDEDAWHQLEAYIEKNTEALFTHTLCKSCMQTHYPELWEKKFGPVKK